MKPFEITLFLYEKLISEYTHTVLIEKARWSSLSLSLMLLLLLLLI